MALVTERLTETQAQKLGQAPPSEQDPEVRRQEIERLEILERATGGDPDVMGRGNIARLEELRSLEAAGHTPARPQVKAPWEQEAARQIGTPGELGVFTQKEQVKLMGGVAPPSVAKPEEVTVAEPARKTPVEPTEPLGRWARAEKYVREKVTYKVLPPVKEVFTTPTYKKVKPYFKVVAPRVKEPRPVEFFYPKRKPVTEKEYEATWGFTKGVYVGVREKPLKSVAVGAAFFVAPPLIAKAGAATGLTTLATRFPTVAKYVGATVKVGLPSLYARGVYLRAKVKPTIEEKAEVLGEVAVTEVAPAIAGGYAGAKFWPKLSGYVRTIGRKEIPKERLIEPRILSGEKRFAEGLPHEQYPKGYLKYFEKKVMVPKELKGFPHATPVKWAGKTAFIGPSESELPGLYVSGRGISPHFLKLSKPKTGLYGGSFFEPTGKPAVMYVEPEAVKAMSVKKVKGVWEWIRPVKPGVAYVPGMKPEVEAIIPPGTHLLLKEPIVKPKYFFKWEGTRVPIDEYIALGEKVVPEVAKTAPTLGSLVSRYAFPSVSYAVSPGGAFGAVAVGYLTKPSKIGRPSYRISRVSPPRKPSVPGKPSKTVSKIISKLPVKPSYYPSPAGVPSRAPVSPGKPSFAPPSKPSYKPPVSYPSKVYPPRKPSYVPPVRPPRRPPVVPPIAWFPKPSVRIQKARPRRERVSRMFRYTPTLVGTKYAKPITEAPKGLIPGFAARPLVKKKKKKKRRKKT